MRHCDDIMRDVVPSSRSTLNRPNDPRVITTKNEKKLVDVVAGKGNRDQIKANWRGF